MTQAWLKQLDDMKAEARTKKTALTPETYAHRQQIHDEAERLFAAGLSYRAAATAAVEKSGPAQVAGTAKRRVRGLLLGLSLDELEGQGWTWHLSASGGGSRADLERAVTRLGGDYHNPFVTPAMTGSTVTHWQWPDREAQS